MNKETIIISLGGSLVAPKEIDVGFLRKFRDTIKKHFSKKRFFIFVGGGKIARLYQKALADFGANNNEKDWAGINISRQNAEIVRHAFGNYAFKKIITDPTEKISVKNDILVAGGWKPGWSTDYCSVMAAKNSRIKTIVNLTNIDYVYDKNPKKFADAKPIKNINWKDFRKIAGNKWSPGLSMPFDPRASKLAEKLKLKVVVINGKKLNQLENFLNNKPFVGTIIQ